MNSDAPHRWEKLWKAFHEAREKDPSQRAVYLTNLEEADPEIHDELSRLLAADQVGLEFFENLVARELNLLVEEEQQQEESIEPGEILAGRFRIVQQLGKGGMGTVYEAFDEELHQPVALKMMHPDLAEDTSARDRFHREINHARQVTHPNACRIFDLFRHDDLLFLTMELLQGKTLHSRIRRSGRMTVDVALPLVRQICEALSAIHRAGIVHRDLKSSNILLVPEGDSIRAVVTDFGLAVPLAGREMMQLTQTGQLLGTPEFMAPEQITKRPVSPATDVYALGLVMYEMVTGEVPMAEQSALTIAAKRISEDTPSPRNLVPDLDRYWERTILRCLERNPKHRFQNADEVITALKGDTITTTIPFLPLRHRGRVLSAIGVGVILLLGFFLFWRHFAPAKTSRSDVAAKRLWTGATGTPPGVLSTDGRILIDVDWEKADVMAIDLPTGKKRRLTNSPVWFVPQDFSEHPITTCLSPDSKQVAFTVKHVWDPGCDLRIAPVVGSSTRNIYSSKVDCLFVFDWSLDQKQLLNLILKPNGSQIALISSTAGSVRTLKSLDSNDVRKMNFSPDGAHVAYDSPQQSNSANHDVFLVSLKDQLVTRLITHPANDYLLGWAADGKSILFASDRSGSYDAWMLPVAGGKPHGVPERVAKDIGQIFPLKLTSDGSLYYSHLLTSNDIYTASLNSSRTKPSNPPTKIVQGFPGSNQSPEFSSDGKYLLFQAPKNPLATRWIVNNATTLKMLFLETGEESDFPHQADFVTGRMRWSPTQKALLVYRTNGDSGSGVYSLDSDTGKLTSVVRDPPASFVRQFRWSADGNAVYYIFNKGGKIWRKDLATGNREEIASSAADFDISPDGRILALMSVDVHKGRTSLGLRSLNGSVTRKILELRMPEWISTIAWAPDNQSLFFTKGLRDLIDTPHRLFSIPVHGGPPRDLGIETESVFDLRIHPDGRRIALGTTLDSSELWVRQNFLAPH